MYRRRKLRSRLVVQAGEEWDPQKKKALEKRIEELDRLAAIDVERAELDEEREELDQGLTTEEGAKAAKEFPHEIVGESDLEKYPEDR
jgi:hypothetical protein